jgi:hypothetical protein
LLLAVTVNASWLQFEENSFSEIFASSYCGS